MRELKEPILADDYPVNPGYLYVVDGRVEASDIRGNVGALKQEIILQGRTANEVRRCDIYGRKANGVW